MASAIRKSIWICIPKRLQCFALTDHGNMNGMSHQILHAKKMKEEGKDFKPIFGVEAYFVPSVKEWKDAYEKAKEDKKTARELESDPTKTANEDEGASKSKSITLFVPPPSHLDRSKPNRSQ
jgi:hypothetical protein